MAGNNLKDFRANEDGDRSPLPADDVDHSAAPSRDEPRRAQQTETNDEPPTEPTLIQDKSREAIAERFKRQRAERRAEAVSPRSHVPAVDGDLDITDPNDPDYIAPENDEQQGDGENDDGEQAPQPRQTAPKPADQRQPEEERRFELKVNGNTYRVTRDELIQHAGLEPADADGIPEVSLQRAAQVNLAAQARLEDAKRRSTQTRQSGAEQSGTPADEDQTPSDEQDQPRRARTPSEQAVELIRQIQFGEPEDAAAMVEDLLDGRLSQHTTELSQHQIVEDATNAIAAFGQENADLAADDLMADSLKSQMVRLVVKELRPFINDFQAQLLLNDPQKATQVYVAALAERRGVRPLQEILKESGDVVRQRFNVPRAQRQTPQDSQSRQPQSDRRNEKRMLPRQPAPSGVQQNQRQQPPQDRRANASEVIARMRASRFQTSGP